MTLRTKMTALFMLAACPSIVVSALAIWTIDELIEAEIREASKSSIARAQRAIGMERKRLGDSLTRLSREPAVEDMLHQVRGPHAPDISETVAARLATKYDLDILSVVALTGTEKQRVLSSAHLPAATGDDSAWSNGERAGFAEVLIAANPPRKVPALTAKKVIRFRGQETLLLVAGRRLDGAFLNNLATGRDLRIELEVPKDTLVFGRPFSAPARRINIDAMEAGGPSARLAVMVSAERLLKKRRFFVRLAVAVTAALILLGILVGASTARRLSAPILGLAEAAEQVADGDLTVRLESSRRDEVGGLMRVFNRMVVELGENRLRLARSERIAAWREAAKRVAHEIKNPLTPMRMAMETLRKAHRTAHPDYEAILEESTTAVLEEVQALSNLVQEFSNFARLPKPRIRAVPVLDLVESSARLYGAVPEGIEFHLEVEGGPELTPVAADREQITRCLINLVKNAIEAVGPEGGTVTLRAHRRMQGGRPGVRLQVQDTGPGIEAHVKDRLFEPYVTTKADGTGLGLAIVDQILSEHDGTIEVDSAPQQGTTVSIWLPQALDAGVEDGEGRQERDEVG